MAMVHVLPASSVVIGRGGHRWKGAVASSELVDAWRIIPGRT